MRLLTILCLVLLSPYSYSQEVVTGHVLIRDGIYYHQDTNEPVTGIVEEFYNGQLEMMQNCSSSCCLRLARDLRCR